MSRQESKKYDEKNAFYKQEVLFIDKHKITKHHVLFEVHWKGYAIFTDQTADFIATKKKGRDALMDYLVDLQMDQRIRWDHMMKKDPTIAQYLKTASRNKRS